MPQKTKVKLEEMHDRLHKSFDMLNKYIQGNGNSKKLKEKAQKAADKIKRK